MEGVPRIWEGPSPDALMAEWRPASHACLRSFALVWCWFTEEAFIIRSASWMSVSQRHFRPDAACLCAQHQPQASSCIHLMTISVFALFLWL